MESQNVLKFYYISSSYKTTKNEKTHTWSRSRDELYWMGVD